MGERWKKEVIIKWVEELGYRPTMKSRMKVERDNTGDPVIRVNLFTNEHRYSIAAYDPHGKKGKSYLGCICHNRKPLAGESHLRCGDLADGPLTKSTWERIKGDIIATELVALGE